MSDPKQTCRTCGRYVIATPSGQGFPPDIAKRKLKKICDANPDGHKSDPHYTAGIILGGYQATGQ